MFPLVEQTSSPELLVTHKTLKAWSHFAWHVCIVVPRVHRWLKPIIPFLRSPATFIASSHTYSHKEKTPSSVSAWFLYSLQSRYVLSSEWVLSTTFDNQQRKIRACIIYDGGFWDLPGQQLIRRYPIALGFLCNYPGYFWCIIIQSYRISPD